jgi:hypothetical protein
MYGMMLAGLVAAACGKAARTDAPASDPNRPAVVQSPPVILRPYTAHSDTMTAYRERMDSLAGEMSKRHGFMGAMVVMGDRRVLASYYHPDAKLTIGDSTFSGPPQIATGLVMLARNTSIKEFLRGPRVVHATDSVAVDSGAYLIIS